MSRAKTTILVVTLLLAVAPAAFATEPPGCGCPHGPRFRKSTFDGTAWTNGVVPYRFAATVTSTQRDRVREAMAEIEAVCGVDFVVRNGEADYVTIRPNQSSGCTTTCSFAGVGMQGGEQFVNIGSQHWNSRYVIVHEFFHTLGFRHEHQRPDRGTYVQILTGNIHQTACGGGTCNNNFNIRPGATTYGPYDFASIMHYGQNSFSDGTGPTIIPQPQYASSASLMGNRTYMTGLDALGLRAVYGAPPSPTLTSITPGFMVLGAGNPTITLTGTGFFLGSPNSNGVQGTKVEWNGQTVASTFVSPTEMQFTVTAGMLASAGAGCVSVNVDNDFPGADNSNALTFNIIDIAPTAEVFRGIWDNDRLGDAVAGILDVNGDGQDDLLVGAPGYLAGTGRITCHSGATGVILWSVNGANGASMGSAIASVSDVDGDGTRDVLCGAPGYNGGRGRLYVLRGSDGTTIRTRTGGVGDSQAASVANAGDCDGDGVDDHLVGAPGWSSLTGRARLYSGATGNPLFTWNGSAAGDQFGSSVSGGYDLGANGGTDVVIGAPFRDAAGTNSGTITAYSGQTGLSLYSRNGQGANDHFGFSVAMIPAEDGSGRGNVVVGAPEPGDIFGNGTGPGYVRIYGTYLATGPLLATLSGDAVGDRFGGCVSYAGDLDQDGLGDFIVGAWQGGTFAGGAGTGYVRVYSGQGQRELYREDGVAVGDRFGWACAPAGDVDGDGRGDVIVGAPLNDATCPGAGEARVLHPPVPPSTQSLRISEVTWSPIDGIEITNYGPTQLFLNGWTATWDDGVGARKTAALSSSLQPGESMVVLEPGPVPADVPAAAQVLQTFPGLRTTGQGLTVTLIHPSGEVVDGVRVESSGGTHTLAVQGELFRGLAPRSPGSNSAERIWGLDSNSGADWTAQAQASLGRENLSSGPRGTDPIAMPIVRMSEIDTSPDYIEIVQRSLPANNVQHWYFLASASNTGNVTLIRPWPAEHNLQFGSTRVIGDGPAAPAELPALIPYVNLAAVNGGNIPLVSEEYSVGLYDSYGRLIDLVCTFDPDGPVVHNAPRLPAHWSDFQGAAPATTLGDRAVGRVTVLSDSDDGGDWRAVETRSMGSTNPGSSFVGPLGDDSPLDARVVAAPFGGLAFVLNAGPGFAGHTWYFLVSAGHLDGQGPFLGLGQDAVNNFLTFGTMPPFTGVLDAEGATRLDLDVLTPPGIDLDLRFFLFDAGGNLSAQTPVLEYDS